MIDETEEWWLNELFGIHEDLGIKTKKRRSLEDTEIDFIQTLIQTGELDEFLDMDTIHSTSESTPRRFGRTRKINYYTDTLWGRYLMSPDIKIPTSKIAREFRRRFRVPFPVFDKVIVPECDRLNNVFDVVDQARVRIPTDFKVMICLRILGN